MSDAVLWCEEHRSGFNWRDHETQFGPRCDAFRLMSWPNPPAVGVCRMVKKVLVDPDSWRLRPDFDVLPHDGGA
jgi:hypothetical protein